MTFANMMAARSRLRIAPLRYLWPFLQGSAKHESAFLDAMHGRFGDGVECVPIGRARTGIALLVSYAVRQGRKKVLLSPNTIPVVVNMVLMGGGQPVFFDNVPNSSNADVDQIRNLLDDSVACVLVTHHHVNQDRMAELQELCHERGAFLFDDCAIAFGGSHEGQPIGTLSDGSVFSFSFHKFLNFYWGGLITTRNVKLAEFVRNSIAEWPRLSAKQYLKTARPYLMYDVATRPPVFNLITMPMFARNARRARGVEVDLRRPSSPWPVDGPDPTYHTRPGFAAFAEWTRKLDEVDRIAAHRRKIVQIYLQHFRPMMLSAESSPATLAGSCFVNFPIVVGAANRERIWRRIVLAGFDVGRSLYLNAHEAEEFKNIPGSSVNVSDIVRSTIYLPTHFGVSESYARTISAAVAEIIAEERSDITDPGA